MTVHEWEDPASDAVLSVRWQDVVRVVLPQVAGTGYLWSVAEHGRGLEVLTSEDVAGDATPGAAGHHAVRLHARHPGAWPVRLVLRRPWEQAVTEERRLTVAVR